jgi:hypothetical protein
MAVVGKFKVKVNSTSDKKKLKGGTKTYTYGTISIRDPKLNKYIGKEVILKIIIEDS